MRIGRQQGLLAALLFDQQGLAIGDERGVDRRQHRDGFPEQLEGPGAVAVANRDRRRAQVALGFRQAGGAFGGVAQGTLELCIEPGGLYGLELCRGQGLALLGRARGGKLRLDLLALAIGGRYGVLHLLAIALDELEQGFRFGVEAGDFLVRLLVRFAVEDPRGQHRPKEKRGDGGNDRRGPQSEHLRARAAFGGHGADNGHFGRRLKGRCGGGGDGDGSRGRSGDRSSLYRARLHCRQFARRRGGRVDDRARRLLPAGRRAAGYHRRLRIEIRNVGDLDFVDVHDERVPGAHHDRTAGRIRPPVHGHRIVLGRHFEPVAGIHPHEFRVDAREQPLGILEGQRALLAAADRHAILLQQVLAGELRRAGDVLEDLQ